MMNVRRTKTALLWLLLLTSTATFAQSDGHFSDEDQESPTTEAIAVIVTTVKTILPQKTTIVTSVATLMMRKRIHQQACRL